ncbi:MAG: formate dehydrogenase accessory sulfurtransferase FdhD [Paracoccaceae bacterium]|nr:formate dehydrogenase accessory sulfurtransferase FdhD [Paracoccaceae bacterium]
MAKNFSKEDYLVSPDTLNNSLFGSVVGIDHNGIETVLDVIEEKPLTIFLNSQEIVTAMTIGDHPEYLAIGFLYNQKMLTQKDQLTSVEFDAELNVVVVRTSNNTNFEDKLKKKTRTSGCAVGTVFGNILEGLEEISLKDSKLRISWLYGLANKINRTDSLYLKVGAIHGTVLCVKSKPICYMEDVGRHNAVDKISGWMISENIQPDDKILYTTGRLTSEMVIKTAHMGIPILISRSGFTAWGVELAKKLNMTLIGRMRGKRFCCLSGRHRLIFDTVLK